MAEVKATRQQQHSLLYQLFLLGDQGPQRGISVTMNSSGFPGHMTRCKESVLSSSTKEMKTIDSMEVDECDCLKIKLDLQVSKPDLSYRLYIVVSCLRPKNCC